MYDSRALRGPRMQLEYDEEEEDLAEVRKPKKSTRRPSSQPLDDPDEVLEFVKKMLDSVGKATLVRELLQRLELTNAESSLGKEVLRKFVRLHGLRMLKFWLGEWKNDQEMVEKVSFGKWRSIRILTGFSFKVLRILKQLPLSNRNGLEDADMFEFVGKLTNHENEDIAELASGLLEDWQELKHVYRIPKRPVSQVIWFWYAFSKKSALVFSTVNLRMRLMRLLEMQLLLSLPPVSGKMEAMVRHSFCLTATRTITSTFHSQSRAPCWSI